MAKRTLPASINMNEHTSNAGLTVIGHSGHVLTVYPDKAVFCETDNQLIKDAEFVKRPL